MDVLESVASGVKPAKRKIASWVASIAAGAMIAGSLVAVGVGAQMALAAGPAPGVAASTPESYIWGEDLPIDITFTGTAGAGAQFNASAGVVLPADATVVDTGTLGVPIEYAAGTVLPGQIISGSTPNTCEAIGLEDATSPAGACQVPVGKQYLVFQNISDLPEGATASHTLTVRPDAAAFELGEPFPYQVNGYTNGDERFLPVFPGSTGVNTPDARDKSSNPGIAAHEVAVNGLRITKTETRHDENEVLRGVHGDRGAIYELRIEHTGQSDLANAVVVDYLPAGLEYLTSCELANDNTTNANGTQGSQNEYPGSGALNTASVGADCLAESLIETVQGSFDKSGNFTEGSGDGSAVFTKVTWSIGTWLMSNPGGLEQSYPNAAGTPAATTIRYRAGVPLYENTMDFGRDIAELGATGQGANLDNNRGAPTRHGTDDLDAQRDGDGAGANGYTNTAIASGSYIAADGAATELFDYNSETIDAVDVRIVKTVNGGEAGSTGAFGQGDTARYGLNLATSEYVSAVQGDPSERPLRIVDDMADGLCPVFGPGTKLWQNADGSNAQPNLILGGYNPYEPGTGPVTVEDWNAALVAAGVDSACQWDGAAGHSQGAAPETAMTGGQLVGIAFSPKTGRFFLELALADKDALNAADSTVSIEYSVHQNTTYIKGTDAPNNGATTSRDIFENEAEINLRTTPIKGVLGVGTPGMSDEEQARLDASWNAWDDSHAWVQARDTSISKKVLERGDVPARGDVWKSEGAGGPDANRWVDSASIPFAVGDQTWYRIAIDPPNGADVRNPVLTDFLPEGVSFDKDALNGGTNRYEDMFIVPTGFEDGYPSLGSCEYTDPVDWLNTFVPQDGIKVTDNVLTFALGATGEECGLGGTDRFLPFKATLEIYIKVTVTDPSAFGKVDLPQNLAKYQQENDEGEIFFLRDDATIEADRAARLLKGVTSVENNDGDKSSTREAATQDSADGTAFNSNRDGIEVVQGEEVTYRLDVTAPYTTTDEYLVWDVLPEGIKADDLDSTLYTANLVAAGVEGAEVVDFEATAYDSGSYPAGITLKPGFEGRSIIVWNVTSEIPASTKEIPATTDENGVELIPAVPAVERGLTLGYTVTVPDGAGAAGALVSQEYVNDASIVEFNTVNNGGGQSTVIVDGADNVAVPRVPSDTNPGFVFEDVDNDTSDPSNIFLPDAEMSKTLVATEVGPNTAPNPPAGENDLDANNLDDVIVQGEYATYDISVTIPANTTVRNGVLADNGTLQGTGGGTSLSPSIPKYQLASAKFVDSSGAEIAVPTDFTLEDDGTLKFPDYYQNDTAAAQTFTVQLVLWVNDVDASNPETPETPKVPNADRPQIPNDKGLRNTATFNSTNVKDGANTTLQDTADVTYREPDLQILKSADKTTNVNIDDTVTYTLEVKNVNRVKSYDNVVVDKIPAGLLVQTDSFKIGSTSDVDATTTDGVAVGDLIVESGATDGTGGTITWNDATKQLLALAEVPDSVFLFYKVKIDPTTGAGEVYENTAKVTGYTLPATVDGESTTDRRGDRESTAKREITATTADIDKTVRKKGDTDYIETASAPIGQTVQYKVDVTLNANINYYDIEVRDALTAGVELQTGTVNVKMSTGGAEPVPVPDGDWTRTGSDPNHVWKYTKAGAGGDLTSSDAQRVLTFTYDVVLKNAVDQNVNSLPNTAGVTWATTDGGDKRDPITDPAGVTVLNPALQIVKKVDGEDSITRNPDASFDYTLTVSQTAQGNTPAYAITVQDVVPVGVVVTPGSITNGGKITGVGTNGGGTITWQLAGPLNHAGAGDPAAIELGYSAKFADSKTLDTAALENVANVTHFESFDPTIEEGRSYDPPLTGTGSIRDTADVTPLFPKVDPVKTVTAPVEGEDYGLAYVDTPFGWTLTITNNGAGAAESTDVVDTLPANWSYVGGTAKVNNQTLADRTPGTDDGNTTLTWTTEQLNDAIDDLFPLAAGGKFVITFDAKPNDAAIDTPGTGLPVGGTGGKAHVNTVEVTNVTDTQGNNKNANDDYAGVDDTANAYIAEADLLLEKAAIGGTSADIALSNGEALPKGSWLAGGVTNSVLVPADADAGTSEVTYAQPQWQLTVTNHGPDASFGAFTVTEQQTLPAGVTVSDWQAQYFAAGATTGTALPVTVTGSGANLSLTVGHASTSLNAAGTDRIVITANVHVPAGTTATAADLKNIATVEGETFERDGNKVPPHDYPNTDEEGKALSSVADLAIVKTFAPVEGDRNAGDIINWNLTVTNHGPDHSLSTSGDGNQIVVVDDVPGEIVDPAIVEGSLPAGWAMTQDGQKFTFTLTPEAQLNSGASVSFSFSGRIGGSVAAGTEIVNSATVSPGETPDPYTPNNEDEDTTDPVTADTSVAASKQRVVLDAETDTWVPVTGEVTAGDTVSYRLQLTNTGSYVAARGVTLTDELPSYLTYGEWSAETPAEGWSFSQTGQALTFTNPDAEIAPGGTASVILTAIVAADYRNDVVNTVCVTTGNIDPDQLTIDDCATSTTGSDKSVDWELLKSHVAPAEGEPAKAGETVRYRLVLNNNGPSVSDGPITITDALPAGFSYAGNVVATGATLSNAVVDGQTVTWTADGPFAVGAGIVTVEFDALVAENAAPGVYLNEARVDGPVDEPDTNPGNNDDDDEVPVIRDAQMHIDKQVQSVDTSWGETAEHAAGTTVTWRVKITNSGPSAAPVTFSDDLALAPGVTLTGLDGGADWACDTDAQQCAYVANDGLFPVTAADESNAGWITITTSLAANVAPTGAPGLVNWGKIVWADNTTNPDLPDNGNSASDDANITTVRNADLGLVKQVLDTAPEGEWIDADGADSAGSVVAGLSTSYRVLVSNNGPSDAVAPLIVTDALPAGATFEGLTESPEWSASYDEATHSVTLTRDAKFGGLAVGATPLAVEYEVSFGSALAAGSVLENTASFDRETLETNGDTNPENDTNPANVVVERQIDLGIAKSHDADAARIGDALPFVIDVTNHGPSEASGIVVTDTVPAGLAVLSEVGPVLDADGVETGWTIDAVELAQPGDATVDPVIPVDAAAGAIVTASYAHPLAPGESAAPLVINTLVTAAAYDTVTNVVDVTANEPEPDPDTENPNRAEDPVIVPPLVTLVTEKTAIGEFQVGKTGTFEITVENQGPTADPGPITVLDALPNGLTFRDSPNLPAGVTVDVKGKDVTWTITDGLAVGEKVTLTLEVLVSQGAYPEVTNTVVVDSPAEKTPDSVLEDSATVKVKAADPLAITGGDLAAFAMLAALLLVLGGAATAMAARRKRAVA